MPERFDKPPKDRAPKGGFNVVGEGVNNREELEKLKRSMEGAADAHTRALEGNRSHTEPVTSRSIKPEPYTDAGRPVGGGGKGEGDGSGELSPAQKTFIRNFKKELKQRMGAIPSEELTKTRDWEAHDAAIRERSVAADERDEGAAAAGGDGGDEYDRFERKKKREAKPSKREQEELKQEKRLLKKPSRVRKPEAEPQPPPALQEGPQSTLEAPAQEQWRSLKSGDVFLDTLYGDSTVIVETPDQRPDGHFWARNTSKQGKIREYELEPKTAEDMLRNKRQYVLNPPLPPTVERAAPDEPNASQQEADRAENASQVEAIDDEHARKATRIDEKPSMEKPQQEKVPWPDVNIGDQFYDTKFGDTTVVLDRVENPNHPEGGFFRVRNTSRKGKSKVYPLKPSTMREIVQDPRYERRAPSPDAKPLAAEAVREKPPQKKKEKPPVQPSVGDVLIDTQTGERATVIRQVREKKYRMGFSWRLAQELPNGKIREFFMNPGYVNQLIRSGRFKLEKAAPPPAPPPIIEATPEQTKPREAESATEAAAEEVTAAETPEAQPAVEPAPAVPLENIEETADLGTATVGDARMEAAHENIQGIPETDEILKREAEQETKRSPFEQASAESPLEQAHEHIHGIAEIDELLQKEQDEYRVEQERHKKEARLREEDRRQEELRRKEEHGRDREQREAEALRRESSEGPPTETAKPEETPAAKEKKSEEVEKYSEAWINREFASHTISETDLATLPHYKDFSVGQKAMLLENFKQMLVGRIEEEAAGAFRQNTNEARFLGRAWRNIARSYFLAKEKAATHAELVRGGITTHGRALSALADGMYRYGPDVTIEDGALDIHYVREKDFGSPLTRSEQEVVQLFNEAATAFGKTPSHWQFESAKVKERSRYGKEIARYVSARRDILALLESRHGREAAASYMNRIDRDVALNQYLNENPDAEKELHRIRSESIWPHAVKNVVVERGLYMAGGYLSRFAAIGMLGALGAPLAAAGMGGLLAYRRGREGLRERDVLARKGVRDEQPGALNVVAAKKFKQTHTGEIIDVREQGLVVKINRLVDSISSMTDEKKRGELAAQLDARLKFTQMKLKEGLVNFGSDDERFSNQYDLVYTLSRGSALLSGLRPSPENPRQTEVEMRLERFLNFKDRTISAQRKKNLLIKVAHGAVLSASFAIAGRALASYFHPETSPTAPEGLPKSVPASAEKIVSESAMHPEGTAAQAVPRAPEMQESELYTPATPRVEEEQLYTPVSGEKAFTPAAVETAVEQPEAPAPIPTPEVKPEEILHESQIPYTPAQPPGERLYTPASGEAPVQFEAPPAAQVSPYAAGVAKGFDAVAAAEQADMTAPAAAEQAAPIPESAAAGGGAKAAAEQAGVTVQAATEQVAALTRELSVEIHKGEGMIKALGRSLEEQYHLNHARSMELANRIWAEHKPQEWYNLVHEGDTFKVHLKDIDAHELQTSDVRELAREVEYDPQSFSYEKSGIPPAHELPHIETAVPVTPSVEVSQDIFAMLNSAPNMKVNQEASVFLADHHMRFDPHRRELWIDDDGDGVISPKEILVRLGAHFETTTQQVGETSFSTNMRGHLVIETVSADHAAKEVIEILPDRSVIPHLESLVSQEPIYEVQGRLADKVHDLKEMLKEENLAKLHHGRSVVSRFADKLYAMRASAAAADKGSLIKKIQEDLSLPKSDAKKLAKPLYYVFKNLKKFGVPLGERDTIASVLAHVEVAK